MKITMEDGSTVTVKAEEYEENGEKRVALNVITKNRTRDGKVYDTKWCVCSLSRHGLEVPELQDDIGIAMSGRGIKIFRGVAKEKVQ